MSDETQRARVAHWYRAAFDEYRASAAHSGGLFATDVTGSRWRIASSVEYLADNLHRVPLLLVACIETTRSSVLPDANQASMWGSLFPAVWSYMLAARARGLGTVWTDLHLRYEKQVSDILGIPDNVRQGVLVPTAYARGTNFQQGPRTPVDAVVHIDNW